MAFCFTDGEWDKIAGLLERAGRPRDDDDRKTLEFICGRFAKMRPVLGRDLPTPKRARNAWLKVAVAARRLEAAITGLRKAGAADFTMLDQHQGGAAKWAAQLPLMAEATKFAAKLETPGVRRRPGNADPMRDAFLKRLLVLWTSFGGSVSHAADGRCIQFLAAASGAALRAADEKPMTVDQLRASVRRLRRVANQAPK